MGRTIHDWFFRTVGSTRSMALIRIGLGLLSLYRFSLFADVSLARHGLGWWIAFNIAAACMIVGFQSQVATIVAGVIALATHFYFSVWLGDVAWAHHHTYFLGIAALLLGLGPCGRSYSVDRLLAVRKARRERRAPPREEGNLFALRMLAIQLAILYFFAFWDKVFIAGSNELYWNFLNGSRVQQIFLFFYRGSDFQFPAWAVPLTALAACTVALLELVLPLILFERFRKWLVLPGLALHVGFYVMLPLATYSLTCMVLYLAVFDANRVHGVIDLLGPKRPPVALDDAEPDWPQGAAVTA